MKAIEARFGKWVVEKRWLIIVATFLLVGMSATGIAHLEFVNEGRVFFGPDNPQLKALEALEDTFTKNENIMIVVAPKDGNIFTRKTLAALEELTEAAWQTPYSNRVDSITNFQHTVAEEDDLIVADLVENAEELSDDDLVRIRKIALSEPVLVNGIISDRGHVAGININIIKPGKHGMEAPEAVNFVRKIVKDFKKDHPDIDLRLTGGILMGVSFGEASQRDGQSLLPIMFLTILALLGLLLRSFSGVFVSLLVIIMAAITGLGLGGYYGIDITPASANAPIIILTLAVADSVHLLVTMFHEMRQGRSKHEAITESVRINLTPVFLTSVTTAIGFLSMNFSDAPPFHDLGNLVATGVIAAFFYSILFLPAMMAVLPVKVVETVKSKNHLAMVDRFADFVICRQTPIFWGMILVIVALSAGMTRIELDDVFYKYFDERYQFRLDSDFAMENLTGSDVIEYALESGEPGGINNPEYLKKVDEFVTWYRSQPKVVNILTITDTMKRLNKSMHGDDEAYYRLPEERNLAAQYLLLYEMSLPFGLDLNNQINVDKSATRMMVTLNGVSAKELRETDDRARAWLRANAPEHMFTYGAGISVMWSHISQRNIEGMLFGSFVALALISAILVLALRSLKLGALSLVPNLAPAMMAFGAWGYFSGQVGLAVSVLVALTLGIVVDDTVHFMSKYIRARREHGYDPERAVRYSFHTVGAALTISTVVLVAGFAVLGGSGFKVNSDMGVMTAITITLALVLDFLFLPTILMKAEGSDNV